MYVLREKNIYFAGHLKLFFWPKSTIGSKTQLIWNDFFKLFSSPLTSMDHLSNAGGQKVVKYIQYIRHTQKLRSIFLYMPLTNEPSVASFPLSDSCADECLQIVIRLEWKWGWRKYTVLMVQVTKNSLHFTSRKQFNHLPKGHLHVDNRNELFAALRRKIS